MKLSIRQGSTGIIITVVCAAAGFIITKSFMNENLIQYASLPKTVSLKVHDGAKNESDSVVFNLPVISKFAIDTFPPETEIKSNVVERNILFHENPYFPVWGMLVLVMITIASGSVPVFVAQILQLKRNFGLDGKQIAAGIIFAVIVAIFLALSNSSAGGYYRPQKILSDFHIIFNNGNMLVGIVVATILLMLPIFTAMFLIGPACDKLLNQKISKDNIEIVATKFEMLNQSLRGALQVSAIIVVFTVLTSGTLKETIKATVEIKGYDIFPTEVSYTYGIFFSLFLCVIYLPIYFYLKQKYIDLKGAAAGISDLGENKEKVLAAIDFKTSAIDNLKTALTMLAPLLSSFLPENLHLFK
jgi:hypothetical protein